jgi:hypothetical protein
VSADQAKPVLLFLRLAAVAGFFDFKPAYAAFFQHSPVDRISGSRVGHIAAAGRQRSNRF